MICMNEKLVKVVEYLILIPQSISHVIDVTPPEQPESPPVAPKAVREKGIATDDVESLKKMVKALSKVHPDPDKPVRVPYEIHGKLYTISPVMKFKNT
nr:hypothetical protein [Tanacetum cinerariifolium]